MNIFALIGQIFKPAAELIDNLHTSDEERLTAKASMLETQALVMGRALDYENEQLKVRASIINAETKSESWITRSWRPILMLSLAASVLAYWFGLTPTDPSTGLSTIPVEIVNRMYSLVEIGVGGYIAGRSAEKIVPAVVKAMKKKEEV